MWTNKFPWGFYPDRTIFDVFVAILAKKTWLFLELHWKPRFLGDNCYKTIKKRRVLELPDSAVLKTPEFFESRHSFTSKNPSEKAAFS